MGGKRWSVGKEVLAVFWGKKKKKKEDGVLGEGERGECRDSRMVGHFLVVASGSHVVS